MVVSEIKTHSWDPVSLLFQVSDNRSLPRLSSHASMGQSQVVSWLQKETRSFALLLRVLLIFESRPLMSLFWEHKYDSRGDTQWEHGTLVRRESSPLLEGSAGRTAAAVILRLSLASLREMETGLRLLSSRLDV